MWRIVSTWGLLSAVAAVALLAAVSAGATQVEPREFTCPVCATKFTGNALVNADKTGGTDSDFCTWPRGTPALPYEMQVCPTCFYAARNEGFSGGLYEATKTAVKAALEKWKEGRAEITKVEDLSPGQRWELAAICMAVRKAPMTTVGGLYQRAAWATRQCAGAGLDLFGFDDPLSAFETLDEMEAAANDEKDSSKQVDSLLKIVFGAQRAGDVKRRDATVRRLERLTLGEPQKAKLAALKKAFDVEKAYLEKARACFRDALEKEETPPDERDVYLFLSADLTRRLGDDAAALKGYREVKAAPGKTRRDIASLCDFLINCLSPEQ